MTNALDTVAANEPLGAPAAIDITWHDDGTMVKVREALTAHVADLDEQTITDMVAEMQGAGVLFRERLDGVSVQDVSDGYHTFRELYDHRCVLTAVLATIGAINGDAWRSKAHHPDDAAIFDGYFIVGIDLPSGVVTYHYPLTDWDRFEAVQVLEHAPQWDGHSPADTVDRLLDFAQHLTEAMRGMAGGTVTYNPPDEPVKVGPTEYEPSELEPEPSQ